MFFTSYEVIWYFSGGHLVTLFPIAPKYDVPFSSWNPTPFLSEVANCLLVILQIQFKYHFSQKLLQSFSPFRAPKAGSISFLQHYCTLLIYAINLEVL